MDETQHYLPLETKLAELEELIAEAKGLPMSASIRVNRADVDALVGEIRAAVPDEMKQARWVVKERDDVIKRAHAEAESVISSAHEERLQILESTEIVKSARVEAEQVLADAREDARRLRLEADDYVDAQLAKFEILLQKTLATVERGRENLRGRLGADALAEAVAEDD